MRVLTLIAINVTIILTETFKADIEYYEKKKKYRHIDEDIGRVVKDLAKGELIGDVIPRT